VGFEPATPQTQGTELTTKPPHPAYLKSFYQTLDKKDPMSHSSVGGHIKKCIY